MSFIRKLWYTLYLTDMLWVKIKFCVNLFYLGWCVSYFNNICVVALVIHEWVLPPNAIPVFLKSAFMYATPSKWPADDKLLFQPVKFASSQLLASWASLLLKDVTIRNKDQINIISLSTFSCSFLMQLSVTGWTVLVLTPMSTTFTGICAVDWFCYRYTVELLLS